ncbi:MAG: T9SS type A sorting domain-containing protein, partial [Ginsengibacter sp.]
INPFDYDNAGNKIYAAGNTNQFLRWENPQTGATFTPVALTQLSGGKVSTVQVSPFTPKRVYFGSSAGKIVKVDNADSASSTPTDITGSTMPAYNVSCVAVGTDDNNLLATYSNFGVAHVWVTTAGGGALAWTNVSGNLPDIPVRWALFYPEDNTKAIIATEAGIFETSQLNGSSTVWTQNASFPFVRTDMIKYRAADGTIAAATHGRGVWTAVIPKTIPYIRFASILAGSTESTTATDGCRNFTDYTFKLNIDLAPTGTATLNLKVDPSSTAKEGIDFDFTTNGSFLTPSKTIIFANGLTTSQAFTVRIYDDAEVEPTETFVINYTLAGITNAVAAPSAKTFTYTITDNDKAPDQGGVSSLYTIGAAAYYLTTSNNGAPFNSQVQSRRSLTLYKASELTAAGIPAGSITSIAYNIAKLSVRPYTNMLIKMGTTSVNYIVDGVTETNNFSTTIVKTLASYSTINGYNIFTLDNPFVWNGTDNIVIEICYDNLTTAPTEILDKTIGYSDGGTMSQGNLYWQDSIPCGTPFNTNFTNFFSQGIKPMIQMNVTATGNPIATSGSNTIYIGGTGANYFYTGTNVIASLANVSSNLGCVAASFIETGNVWQSFSNGMRSQKVFSIEPSTNLNSSYTVGLYYTTAELAGKAPANLKIAKTEAASVAGADGSNTIISSATTYSAYRDGFVFYTPFTEFSKFFLVDASVALPVTLLSFDGALSGNNIQLNWKTSSERNSKYFELQKSDDGNSFVALGKINAAGTSSTERSYSYVDTRPSEVNYYRLKMVDADGRNITSKTILIKNPNITQHLWIGNNPFHDQLEVHLAKTPLKPIMIELISMNGAKVYSKVFGVSTTINLDLSNSKLSSGIYLLKTQVDGTVYTNKVIKE